MVYCLVPADLAATLHEPLRHHFRDDTSVQVIVERRQNERRSSADRRQGSAAPRRERRRIRGEAGRRVARRRAAAVEVEPPPLPRRARRHADRLRFVERIEPPTQKREDEDTARVVNRFQAGDREAFTDLYTRYFDRVYAYLRVALRSPHEAEDATQQVFAKVFEALPRYERRGQPFRAWLFAIVRNEALTLLRRNGRLELVDPEELNGEHRDDESGADTEALAMSWLTDRDLMIFVERLPLTQRQVLVLRFLFEMSSAETGAILGITPSQVRAHQTRAMRFLRARLAAIGREPKSARRPRMRMREQQALILRRRRFALLRR